MSTKAEREERIRKLRACGDAGMCLREAATAIGLSERQTKAIAADHGIALRDGRSKPLTREQRRDIDTLVRRGGYTAEEAEAIVTRPKVKIRATPYTEAVRRAEPLP